MSLNANITCTSYLHLTFYVVLFLMLLKAIHSNKVYSIIVYIFISFFGMALAALPLSLFVEVYLT